jgi:hypothetical protein
MRYIWASLWGSWWVVYGLESRDNHNAIIYSIYLLSFSMIF